jgi:small subunit ribosomal protein S1
VSATASRWASSSSARIPGRIWPGATRPNTRLFGKVTNIADYGCFVEIEEGVEGLVHVSEMDWTNKNVNPHKVVQIGDEVEVMVLDIDEERRRISLGIKQCKPNPWAEFSENFNKGDKVSGQIKSITDFGIFIGLDGGIDGLVHLSDLSWDLAGEDAVRNYKKGEELEPWCWPSTRSASASRSASSSSTRIRCRQFMAEHPKGSIVKGVGTGDRREAALRSSSRAARSAICALQRSPVIASRMRVRC